MKICLVHTPVPELQDDRLDPPMNLLYLAASLQKAGIDVDIVDLSGVPEDEWEFPEAEFYGFSTYTASYNRTVRIKNMVLKQFPFAITIAGGPHASALTSRVSKDFDYVIMGEAEKTLVDLVTGKVDTSSQVQFGQPLPLDDIPFPDYHMVDLSTYSRRFLGKFAFQLFSSRGCPHKCRYCSKLSSYHKIRRRSVGNFLEEIETLNNSWGDVTFRIKDDLFATNRRWLQEFSEAKAGIEYSCNVRADHHDWLPELLVESGCRLAAIGVESGNDEILKAMGKGTTRQQNINAITRLKEVGIEVLAWIIYGYPGETWDTFYDTISLIEEAKPDIVRAYPLIPYPGTQVRRHVKILEHDHDKYFYIHGNNESGFVYETDELSRKTIMEMREVMNERLEGWQTRVEGS